MTTKTTPDLAAKAQQAREEADRLQAEADTADQARDVRVTAALEVLATWRFGTRTGELATDRDAAQSAWAATSADPKATLEELFGAFTALKVASALYFRHAGANASYADQRLGMAHRGWGGSDTPRPRPQHDYLANTSFSDALNSVIATRAAAAIAAETLKVDTRTAGAVAKAEQG